ncbi:HAD family hydrolase [Shewanella colwelliana]|uniref:HAD family hydrolase n=1 Tax=Shewanella colwelliana TaxID=23 RepID=UPI0004912861|nr:HAD hydrolase-like protein [Shewanella colwelliana]
MHPIYNYDLYIFDCDGVILNSNKLKIQAMKEALKALSFDSKLITQCVEYFANNFGKSRFHHISHFLDNILNVEEIKKQDINEKLLSNFSKQCQSLYLTAELSPKFLDFIVSLPGKKFVASGSEQNELRQVFKHRGLDKYFIEVFGSPVAKSTLISNIIADEKNITAVMIGDAVSDFEASQLNHIDFYCYIPYSNVSDQMLSLSEKHGFQILYQWPIEKNNRTI